MATIPSIAMIPSGVKASKLYSVLPTDGAGDFTTTRASVATRVNENGLIEEVASNVPRLDYSDGGCPSLLLEPTATNIITYSEDFSNGSWTKQAGITITINTADVISPSGLNNASKIVSTDSTKGFFSLPASTTEAVTRTIYLKGSVGGESVTLKDSGGFGGDITHILTTEWVRYEFKTINDGSTYQGLFIANISVGTIYAFGAQFEENSYATSYIKTIGTTQTRVADTATGSGNSTVINSTEGVLYAEISALSDDLTNRFISLIGTTSANSVSLFYGGGSSNFIRSEVKSNNITQSELTTTSYDITNYNKIAIKFAENDFALWVNGVEVATDISGVTPIGLIDFSFDRENSLNFYGKTKSLQVYTTALSDAELTALTTI